MNPTPEDAARRREYIAAVTAKRPPLTGEFRERAIALLRPGYEALYRARVAESEASGGQDQ